MDHRQRHTIFCPAGKMGCGGGWIVRLGWSGGSVVPLSGWQSSTSIVPYGFFVQYAAAVFPSLLGSPLLGVF